MPQMWVPCCAGDRDDVVKFWDLRMAAQPAARLWPGVRACPASLNLQTCLRRGSLEAVLTTLRQGLRWLGDHSHSWHLFPEVNLPCGGAFKSLGDNRSDSTHHIRGTDRPCGPLPWAQLSLRWGALLILIAAPTDALHNDTVHTCMWNPRCAVTCVWVGLASLTGQQVWCNVSSSQGFALWGMPRARGAGQCFRQAGEVSDAMQYGSASCVGSTPLQACCKRQHGVTNLALSPEGGSHALS